MTGTQTIESPAGSDAKSLSEGHAATGGGVDVVVVGVSELAVVVGVGDVEVGLGVSDAEVALGAELGVEVERPLVVDPAVLGVDGVDEMGVVLLPEVAPVELLAIVDGEVMFRLELVGSTATVVEVDECDEVTWWLVEVEVPAGNAVTDGWVWQPTPAAEAGVLGEANIATSDNAITASGRTARRAARLRRPAIHRNIPPTLTSPMAVKSHPAAPNPVEANVMGQTTIEVPPLLFDCFSKVRRRSR